MITSGKTPVFFPSRHQELLLKACLLEGEDAVTSWRTWRTEVNLDSIDHGSLRLLPLLGNKLSQLNVSDSEFKKYRGLERQTWVRNHLMFRAATLVIRQLRTSNIDTMSLKGIVLASTYYQAMSLRPMDDIDFLVRPADALKTLEILEGLGWRVVSGQFRPVRPVDLAVRAATSLINKKTPEAQVDLHWRLFWARFNEEAEVALWKEAVRFDVGDTECRAPCAADMLLHVCVHGAMWNDIPPVRWITDATLVIRSGLVDWNHLCAQSERLGLDLPLIETLDYLRDVMRVPVPDTVLSSLSRNPVKSIDRLIYESGLQPVALWSLPTALRLHNHVACHEAANLGAPSYWYYFFALLRGRSLLQLVSWVRRRLAQSIT